MLARNQLWQIAALLLLASIAADLVYAKIGMGAVGKPDARACPANLLHGDAMFEIAKPRPAPFLFDRDAMQAERAHGPPQIARKIVGAVDLSGARSNFCLGEATHGFSQHIGVLPEAKIEAAIGVFKHVHLLPGHSLRCR